MGYYLNTDGSDFRIPQDRQDAALAALKAAHTDEHYPSDDRRMYLDDDERASRTLALFFTAWGFDEVTVDDADGAIVGVDYWEDRQEYRTGALWRILAPFIDDGGWIDYRGEDDEHWRYRFQGGECAEIAGRVVYEAPSAESAWSQAETREEAYWQGASGALQYLVSIGQLGDREANEFYCQMEEAMREAANAGASAH